MKGTKTKSSSPNKRRNNTESFSAKSSRKGKTLATIADTSEEIRTTVMGVMDIMNNENTKE